jgi:tRNA pseudouridine55 synthase
MAARARRGLPIHGWLVIDKPAGMTSTAVVAAVKRLLGAAKVGHGGTLDPLATGVLPVALGEATKTVAYVMDGEKEYEFTICWGERRSTDDAEGELLDANALRPEGLAIVAALPAFVGEIEQRPPDYSAVRVAGRRAYELARANEEVTLRPRRVRVHALELVGCPDSDHAMLRLRGGKGVYVRAVARDLAERLGVLGHVCALRRTRVGPFTLAQAISLAQLESVGHSPAGSAHLHSVATALDDIPALALTVVEAERLRRGQAVQVLRSADRMRLGRMADGAVVYARLGDAPVALARLDRSAARPIRPALGAEDAILQIRPVRVLNL